MDPSKTTEPRAPEWSGGRWSTAAGVVRQVGAPVYSGRRGITIVNVLPLAGIRLTGALQNLQKYKFRIARIR